MESFGQSFSQRDYGSLSYQLLLCQGFWKFLCLKYKYWYEKHQMRIMDIQIKNEDTQVTGDD